MKDSLKIICRNDRYFVLSAKQRVIDDCIALVESIKKDDLTIDEFASVQKELEKMLRFLMGNTVYNMVTQGYPLFSLLTDGRTLVEKVMEYVE